MPNIKVKVELLALGSMMELAAFMHPIGGDLWREIRGRMGGKHSLFSNAVSLAKFTPESYPSPRHTQSLLRAPRTHGKKQQQKTTTTQKKTSYFYTSLFCVCVFGGREAPGRPSIRGKFFSTCHRNTTQHDLKVPLLALI